MNAAWYETEGVGLDRRLLHADEASEGSVEVVEEPRVAIRK
jgi:hypothetical protein